MHILVIPKVNIKNLDCVNEENLIYLSKIFIAIPKISKILGIDSGYKVISNCGKDGGQEIDYLHFHILGGERIENCLV